MKKLILLSAIALSTISVYSQPVTGTTTQPPSSAQTPPSTPPTAPAVPPSSTQPPVSTQPPSAAQTPPSTPPTSTVPPSSATQPASNTQAPSAAQQAQPGAQQAPSSAPAPDTQTPPPSPLAPAPVSAPPAAPAPASSAAAGSTDNAWKFGLHATPSIKWLSSSTDGIKTDGAQVGFSYGLVAEYFFQSRYSFCSGIDFAYRGGKLKSTDIPDLKFETNLQYLEIPITIKMHTNEKEKKLFYAKFGVSPGWNIGSTGDDVEGGLNDFYMALKIGGGMEYEISDQTMLFGGLVWNNGFIDSFKSDDFNGKNKSIELEIGILF